MSPLQNIASLLIVIFTAAQSLAMQPPHDFSDKKISELLSLLESNDESVRECAAAFIGDRYRNPEILLGDLIPNSNSPAPELPIPKQVIPALATHLRTDSGAGVRLCALFALGDLRFRTNTTPLIALALADKDQIVRIRTCSALISIAQQYGERLHPKVIPTLIACLDPHGPVENLWQAAYAAEALGSSGGPVIPALRRLRSHPSRKVSRCAGHALAKIQASKIEFIGGDGSSRENAIVIKGAKGEEDGVAAEHAWLREKFPGSNWHEQSELSEGRKHWDEIKFTTAEGDERTIYFDISAFFGK